MRAMVTGAAGFIGSHLCERLLARGDQVVGVDCLTDYYDVRQKRANLEQAASHAAFELLLSDVTSPEVLSRVEECDVVFHQAGQPGVRLSWDEHFAVYVRHNILATQMLLESVRRASTTRMVYASSSSVYGNQSVYPCAESAVPAPYSPYGVTKLAAEHLCGLYARNYATPTVSLRYFTVYGPRQRPDMAFSLFSRAALRGQPVRITGDGRQVRTFTYVDDIVDANLAAADADVAPGSVYNVCGTESSTVNEVVDLMSGLLGSQIRTERVPTMAGDVQRTGGSSELAASELGWSSRTTLAEGLRHHLAWERERDAPT